MLTYKEMTECLLNGFNDVEGMGKYSKDYPMCFAFGEYDVLSGESKVADYVYKYGEKLHYNSIHDVEPDMVLVDGENSVINVYFIFSFDD